MSSAADTTGQEHATRRWVLVPAGSTADFTVKHFWGAGTVTGHFDRLEGAYAVAPDGRAIELVIDAGSLDTGNRRRDKDIRSARFLDVEAHPQVRFISRDVTDIGDGTLHVRGELDAAGKRILLSFDATIRDLGDELEVEATVTVDQRLLGMTWNPLGMVRAPARLHVKALLA